MGTGAILTYHSIDRSGSVLSISPELFAWQMGALADAGIPVVPLNEVRRRAGAVALTFDDAYRNFYVEALPVLRRFNYPATVFAIAGRGSAQLGPGASLPLMSWDELAEVSRCDIEIGAHTVRHPHLASLPFDQACEEIGASQEEIQQRLGVPVESFAYPYGDSSPALRDFVRERFTQGVGVRLDYLAEDDDQADLPRLDVYYLRKQKLFASLFSAGVRRYIQLRRAARELRAHANFLQRSRPLR
jgi:peptidoglycan/xylan/chitin deacetylase (PgdA/CDA1 family)